MQFQGDILYNGEGFDKFYPERTAAYVDQVTDVAHRHLPTLCHWSGWLAGWLAGPITTMQGACARVRPPPVSSLVTTTVRWALAPVIAVMQ